VKKQFVVLVLALIAVLVAAGQLARAAGPTQTPEDTAPYFSADSRVVAYAEQSGTSFTARFTPAGGGRDEDIGVGRPRGFRPGGSELLLEDGAGGGVEVTSTTGTPIIGFDGSFPAWSPDGGWIAYLFAGELYVVNATNTSRRVVATGIDLPSWDQTGPVWSPDGTEIVIASGDSLKLAQADGSRTRTLFTGTNQNVNPTWSADGSTIAFERNAAAHWQIWSVQPDGPNAREILGGVNANYRYPRFSPTGSTLAFISDRQHIPGGAAPYQYALYTVSLGESLRERVADVHPSSPPAWSPTGAQLAVAAGQECLRWGIYVVRSDAYPLNAHRRSNECRVIGTARGELLNGTPWLDIVRGYGGNDTIRTGSGNDHIEGNDGNDVIFGGTGNDAIFGGAGADRISGGPGNDLIIGGNGRDVIDCGPGVDTVEAVGRLDRIAGNCEHVRH
jgi:hypothetical protein